MDPAIERARLEKSILEDTVSKYNIHDTLSKIETDKKCDLSGCENQACYTDKKHHVCEFHALCPNFCYLLYCCIHLKSQ
jgi:hypothetical protein